MIDRFDHTKKSNSLKLPAETVTRTNAYQHNKTDTHAKHDELTKSVS